LSIVRISTNKQQCFLFVEIRTMDKVQKLNSNGMFILMYIYFHYKILQQTGLFSLNVVKISLYCEGPPLLQLSVEVI
jgi:hypothetical protein